MPARAGRRFPGRRRLFRLGRRATAMGVVLLALQACSVGPNYKPPSLYTPSTWAQGHKTTAGASAPFAAPPDPAWWAIFGDPQLTSLEQRLASANLDVRTATVRLAQSRAQGRIVGADQLPTLQGDGSYTRERVSQKGVLSLFGGGASSGGNSAGTFASQGNSANGTQGTVGGIPTATATQGSSVAPFNLFQYGFDTSWELDLWGRVRREVESADAAVEASVEARRSALVSAEAELARDYVMLRGYQAQLRVAEDSLATARHSVQLTQERYQGGLTTDLDVANASAQASTIEGQIPPLRSQVAQGINALSFLLGETPGALDGELSTAHPVPPLPARVPVGVPSELARRRPDIREAEASLHQATAEIGVAQADFYPKITLTGSLGLQALEFKDLGNWAARQYGFGPSISLPIFEGARLKGTLELRRQQQQEAAINYQKTVLQAWHDVDNALDAYGEEQLRRTALDAAVARSSKALELSRARYTSGLGDFLTVLDAERTVLSNRQTLAQSQANAASDLVQL